MSRIRCLQIDAFTRRPFAGNPAAVCLLDAARDEQWMQAVAAELNLSETAFVVPRPNGFDLRWFTPILEVDLCGHATLASAHAIWTLGLATRKEPLLFHTRSGILRCSSRGDLIDMDFPATPPVAIEPPEALIRALDVAPLFTGRSEFDKFVIVDSEDKVRALRPDFAKLREIPMRGVIVTSASRDPAFDFVSRYFAPAAGIDEDPVTGSAHCCLAPYWGRTLGKTEMTALQASARGGVVAMRIAGDRVVLGGHAVTVLDGYLEGI